MRARWLLALALAPLALGCAPPAQRRYEQRLETAPPAARHGVYSERLSEFMRVLDRLQRERLPQAMDVAEERERRLDDVVQVAREMADSASRIPGASAEAGLDPSERAEFDAYAGELADRARALAEEAATLTPAELRARAESVVEVCDGCHARFRIPRERPGS